jgi:hypothetical protein
MSRFDRRLKPEFVNRNVGVMSHGITSNRRVVATPVRRVNTIRSSSPRPGTADCKIPTPNSRPMLGQSVFMGDSDNPNKPSIEVIEKSYNPNSENNQGKNTTFPQDVIFEDIAKKNDMITEKIKQTRDPNMRLLYGHEIRLNIIEGNVDMLNQVKCNEVRESQLDTENKTQIDDMIRSIEQLNEGDLKKEQMIEKINLNVEKINQDICENTKNRTDVKDSYNKRCNDLEDNLLKNQTNITKNHKKIEEQVAKIQEMEYKNMELNTKIDVFKNIILKLLLNTDKKYNSEIEQIEAME